MAFCSNCGNELQEGMKFCANCGTMAEVDETNYIVEEPIQSSNSYEVKNKAYKYRVRKKYKFKGVIKTVILLAVIGIVLGILSENKNSASKTVENKTKINGTADSGEKEDIAVDTFSSTNDTTVEAQSSDIETEVETEEVAETVETEIILDESAEEQDNKGNTNGVDPELKAFMDSYEDFMDEYIDFLNKYESNTDNSIAMLSEYMDMLERYDEFTQKADEYDSEEMSKEDAKYYLDTLNRINKKMIDAY